LSEVFSGLPPRPPDLAFIYTALASALFFTALFSTAFCYAVVRRLLPED